MMRSFSEAFFGIAASLLGTARPQLATTAVNAASVAKTCTKRFETSSPSCLRTRGASSGSETLL